MHAAKIAGRSRAVRNPKRCRKTGGARHPDIGYNTLLWRNEFAVR